VPAAVANAPDPKTISESDVLRFSNWFSVPGGKPSTIRGATADNDGIVHFVLVGDPDATDGLILTSGDARTFAEQSNSLALALRAVCWGSGAAVYVAVGDDARTVAGAQGAYLLSSANAQTWTQRTYPNPPTGGSLGKADALAVCWSESVGKFVAAGGGFTSAGSPNLLAFTRYSSDGITWNDGENLASVNSFNAAIWSDDLSLYVIANSGGATQGNARIYTSPDAINWTLRTAIGGLSSTLSLKALASGAGVAVVGGFESTGSETFIAWSDDGITWNQVDPAFLIELNISAIVWTGFVFIAIGEGKITGGVGSNGMIFSFDGKSWFPLDAGINAANALTWYGKGDFGLIGGPSVDSVNAYIATSLRKSGPPIRFPLAK